ncbi:MAG: flagellar hook assembly protein FlgD [Deltaproteobacteria bacterium]|nr:flagellar hook assembly protein FlgD [Deltaproteobacteria bacterium]
MTTSAISSALLGVSNQASSTSTTDSSSSTTQFLTLFLAELENQDPTEPVSSTELTSQMATLTQVEQSIQSNQYLAALSDYISSTNNASAMSCIGKTVTADTSKITLSSGSSSNLMFTLGSDAANVNVTISDEDGNTVKTISANNLSEGVQSVTWDGTNDSGVKVDAGNYSFTVTATDSSGGSISASTSVTGTVTGVTYSNGIAYLVTEKGQIAYGDVTVVSGS